MKIVMLTALMLAGTACAQPKPMVQTAMLSADNWSASYICADGQLIDLKHDKPAGIMIGTRAGETFTLQEQVGKNPPEFVTGLDSVLVEGDRIRLVRGKQPRLTCNKVPAAPTPGTLWGTLTKLDRMALPPGSRAKVLLVDAARADAPSIEIASTTIATVGNQVPLHFMLAHDPTRVAPRPMTYRLQARIEAPDGQLMYINDTATFVLESKEPQPPVALQLVRVSATAG